MLRIKPLYKNSKGRFMIASAIISSLILLAFGLTVFFSPHVVDAINAFSKEVDNVFNANGTNTDIKIGGLVVDFKNRSDSSIFITVNIGTGTDFSQYIGILPSVALLSYFPMALGGFILLVLLMYIIILEIGFKNINKKNVHQVVGPIKSYATLIIFCWISFFAVIISLFITLASGSLIFTNELILLNFKNFTSAVANVKINDNLFSEWCKSQSLDFSVYWLTPANLISWTKWNSLDNYPRLKVLFPILPSALFLIMQFIGALLGPISWNWINLCVLAAVGDEVAMEILNEKMYKKKKIPYDDTMARIYKDSPEKALEEINSNTHEIAKNGDVSFLMDDEENTFSNVNPKYLGDDLSHKNPDLSVTDMFDNPPRKINVDIADGDLSHKIDAEGYDLRAKLKSRCISFFKNNIKLMELSESSNLTVYNKFKTTYDALVSNKADNRISKIATGVEEYIGFATEIDQKFVDLISRVLSKSRNIFGNYANELDDLITNYFNSVREWNLFKAEMYIEQIFAIVSANIELLAKVGYTLKYRLANNYASVEEKLNALSALNEARKKRDYESYRLTCFNVIKYMSPRKDEFNSLINRMY